MQIFPIWRDQICDIHMQIEIGHLWPGQKWAAGHRISLQIMMFFQSFVKDKVEKSSDLRKGHLKI